MMIKPRRDPENAKIFLMKFSILKKMNFFKTFRLERSSRIYGWDEADGSNTQILVISRGDEDGSSGHIKTCRLPALG
jgi:hypothetical protein